MKVLFSKIAAVCVLVVFLVGLTGQVGAAQDAAGMQLAQAKIKVKPLPVKPNPGKPIVVKPKPGKPIVVTPKPKPVKPVLDKKAVDINTADLKQLCTLPGVGEVTAKRIMVYRTENGPFKSIDDLKNVSGIGDKTLAKLKPFLKLDPKAKMVPLTKEELAKFKEKADAKKDKVKKEKAKNETLKKVDDAKKKATKKK